MESTCCVIDFFAESGTLGFADDFREAEVPRSDRSEFMEPDFVSGTIIDAGGTTHLTAATTFDVPFVIFEAPDLFASLAASPHILLIRSSSSSFILLPGLSDSDESDFINLKFDFAEVETS